MLLRAFATCCRFRVSNECRPALEWAAHLSSIRAASADQEMATSQDGKPLDW